MSGSNFPNGSLVMRVWRFDGSGELLAKFQYFDHAESFARGLLARDKENNADPTRWFYLAVCDSDNKMQAFGVSPTKSEGET